MNRRCAPCALCAETIGRAAEVVIDFQRIRIWVCSPCAQEQKDEEADMWFAVLEYEIENGWTK